MQQNQSTEVSTAQDLIVSTAANALQVQGFDYRLLLSDQFGLS